ncbi:MAG: hypothetical protein IAX21_01900 [Candidatus Bathyarchaeota archaeon]|nr:MAG: hypothetical protein IAX21_01900 [Candidatus Bathyarchaeota archaeon]
MGVIVKVQHHRCAKRLNKEGKLNCALCNKQIPYDKETKVYSNRRKFYCLECYEKMFQDLPDIEEPLEKLYINGNEKEKRCLTVA